MIRAHLLRPLRWLRRFRKRRGYGIHSPAAFQFVTGVIYEKGTYYAYARLHSERQQLRPSTREKDDRLLFRLVNFHHPRAIVAYGEGRNFDMACRYIKTACSCPLHRLSPQSKAPIRTADADCYYFDAPSWAERLPELLDLLNDGTFVVVRNPHANNSSAEAWRTLCADKRVRQSFDLHDFGICQCEARLNKEHFVINYY